MLLPLAVALCEGLLDAVLGPEAHSGALAIGGNCPSLSSGTPNDDVTDS
jgi:hypothetical protein